nr:GNAT family N-acetyltransferase [Sphingomonadaceae bacterium]
MGLSLVPDDQLAAVVTSLEMTARPLPQPLPESPLRLTRWAEPSLDKYRALFRRVGAPWLWFSRLVIADEALSAIVNNASVDVYAAVDRAGLEVGMLELDFRAEGQCEIAYLGL